MAPKRKKKSKKKPNKFNKFLIKSFFWTLAFVALLLVGLIGVAAFYEEGIGKLVVEELKKSLKTDLEIEKAELSLIWDFPRASVSLKNIKLKGTEADSSKYLLDAESLSLKCGMFGLLAGTYKFNSIEINNAKLYVHHDQKGRGNYDIFIGDEDTTAQQNSKLDLSIENAFFNNIAVHYVDDQNDQEFKLKIESSFFAGLFTNEKFDMTSYANIQTESIRIGEEIYLQDKSLGYNVIVEIDNNNNSYTFTDVEVSAEANKFITNGKVMLLEEGMQLDVNFHSEKANLNSLLKLLPPSVSSNFGDFNSNAKLFADANIKGIYSPKKLPEMDINIKMKRGRVTHPKIKSAIRNVGFDLRFYNEGGSSRDEAVVELNNFEGSLGGNPFSAALSVKGLENPDLRMSANGVIPLKAIYGLFGDQVSKGQGQVQIEGISLKGKLNDMMNPKRIAAVELGGKINFKDAGLVVHRVPLVLESGSLSLEDNQFSVKELAFKSRKSDFLVDGNFQNVLPVLLSDSLNSKDAALNFRATLKSDQLDIDELLSAMGPETEVKESELSEEELADQQDSIQLEEIEQRAFITQFLKGSFKAVVGTIKYGKINATDCQGELAFENNNLKLRALKANTMKGSVEVNAKVVFDKKPQMLAFIDCQSIDVHQCLNDLDNFGQETLQARHLRGKLKSLIKINAYWDEYGNFEDDKLLVIADAQLKNGELINLEMMESFSKYVKVKDLRHIRFTDLHNQFKIENKVFHMPAMFIQSNALNLTIAGTHSFDQDIDYKFKINAGQVLANKFKKHNPKLKPLPAKKKGLFNIYARMYGNLNGENYKFKMGKRNVKKYLAAELSQELKALTNTLKSEFAKSTIWQDGRGGENEVPEIKEPESWQDIKEVEGEDEYIEDW